MSRKPMNFAVVGCGALAMQQHVPNLASSPKTVLHTCCDIAEAPLQRCRESFGALKTTRDYREAVQDPEVEAVCLVTTQDLRLPVIELAARCGKPVYCEKPVADNLDTMYAIERVVRESGIPFCVGHNRRFSPAMADARRWFREHMTHGAPPAWRWNREPDARPKLAEDGVAMLQVRINDDWYSWKAWVFDGARSSHGPMLFEMTHFTDLCNWFLDAEPMEVVALESGMLNHGILIRYATGEMAMIGMTGNGTFGYPKELYEAFGKGAAVVVDHMVEVRTVGVAGVPAHTVYPMIDDRHPEIGVEGGISGWLAKKAAACREAEAAGDPLLMLHAAGPDKGHLRMLEAFVDEIRGEGPQACGIADTIRATRTAFAAIRSAQERRPVPLSDI